MKLNTNTLTFTRQAYVIRQNKRSGREQVANSARHYWGKVVDLRAKLRSLGVEL